LPCPGSSPDLEQASAWLLHWLEERVAAGELFKPGESIQIGWMHTRIFGRPGGTLGILEPDFASVPINWNDSVSLTLRHLWIHKEVAVGAGLADQASFPSYRQSAIICRFLKGADTILMYRQPATEADSGWFIGCHSDSHDHQNPTELQCLSLYETAVRHDQRFIPYLALPAGTYVVAGAGVPFISVEDRVVEFAPGSLLAEWSKMLS
jgi:hypothetical protein